jgi:DNA-binding response OmpR family regulator
MVREVLVVSRDRNFRSLVRAQLREERIEALGFETLEAASEAENPSALVFDLSGASEEEFSLIRNRLVQIPAVVIASAGEQLDLPGAQVLRRPVSIGEVVTAVRTATQLRPRR